MAYRESKKKILIAGVGNVLLQDEGVGIHVIQRMKADAKAGFSRGSGDSFCRPDVDLITGDTSGLDLLEEFKGREKVIIIDAAQTTDPPGTLYRLTPGDLPLFKTGETLSVHHINLRDIVNLASFLHQGLPEIVIIAVNIKDMSPGEGLSEEVAEKIPDIIDHVWSSVSAVDK
jgi:hydrogenase maturation protease